MQPWQPDGPNETGEPTGDQRPQPAANLSRQPAANQRSQPAGRHSQQPSADGPFAHLTAEQIERLGRELDAIRDEVMADLGEADARYIRNLIKAHRQLLIAARAALLGSPGRPRWLAGTAALSLAKILENMEIGHNVMHGQWDWMNDPDINSQSWDWDTASPADAWRHSHNYEHHTFTNIRGLDRDLGYEIMRVDPEQRWHPVYLLQPLYNLLLMGFFEWGVALHDLNFEAIRRGEKSKAQLMRELRAIGGKARRQAIKDYTAFPALSALAAMVATTIRSSSAAEYRPDAAGRLSSAAQGLAGAARRSRRAFMATLAANFTANIVRNVWAHSIIFCGHFPEQTYTFSQQEVAEETRGGWYLRQLLGSANIDGSPVFHLMSGNLSFQIEHHLFPDLPSNRYAQIAPRVRSVCERYGLPYNTGPLSKQLGSVHRTILRLAFPGGRRRRRASAPAA